MITKNIRKIFTAALLFLAAAAQAAPPAVRIAVVRGTSGAAVLAADAAGIWKNYLPASQIELVWMDDDEQIDSLVSGRVDFIASVRASQVIMAASRGAELRIAGAACRRRMPVMPEGTPEDDDELVSAVTGRFAMIQNAAVRALLKAQTDAAERLAADPGLLAAPFDISRQTVETLLSENSLDPMLTENDYLALERTQKRLRALGLADDRQLRALIYNRQLRMLIPS
jgi:hypothetical protein